MLQSVAYENRIPVDELPQLGAGFFPSRKRGSPRNSLPHGVIRDAVDRGAPVADGSGGVDEFLEENGAGEVIYGADEDDFVFEVRGLRHFAVEDYGFELGFLGRCRWGEGQFFVFGGVLGSLVGMVAESAAFGGLFAAFEVPRGGFGLRGIWSVSRYSVLEVDSHRWNCFPWVE